MSAETPKLQKRSWFARLGPAIITASVVLGPGSILSSSKIGFQNGYSMTWVLLVAVVLMIGMTALSARLGVLLEGTLCDELAKRAGRPVAALTGISLFLVAACFQFGNNLGVLAAMEPYAPSDGMLPILVIVNLNILVIVVLFGFSALYKSVERLMKFLVAVMIVGFAGNLLLAKPDLLQMLAGLIPSLPEGSAETLIPRWQPAVVENGSEIQPGGVIDNLVPITALFATTFSVGGAFYQSYLVRQKGWTREDLDQGLVDSILGISMLGLITLMIMATSAAVLHGNPAVTKLDSATDVALQLEPIFGEAAKLLFCLGIFAGAFSSFLVNAIIGGSILSDGLGLGGYLDQRWPKLFTVLTLAVGMNVAIFVQATGQKPVNLIIFAQAMTVLAIPVLAAALLWLATRADLRQERQIPQWMKVLGGLGLTVAVFLAIRTAVRLYLQAQHG